MNNTAETRDREDGGLEEERGLPPVNGKKKAGGGGKVGKIAGVAALMALAGAMAWMNMGSKDERVAAPEEAETLRATPQLQFAEPPPPPPVATSEEAPPAPAVASASQPGVQQDGPTEEELLMARRQRAPIIAYGGGGGNQGSAAAAGTSTGEGMGDGSSSLGEALTATRAPMARAQTLPDRNYLIASGSFLDCALITALSSQVPGFTSCRLTRNIYSDNGRVLLLERGSILEGQYQTGQLRQGMSRIFVLWTRARTPNGVVVQLDSPGTDQLGRSGLDGWVDTHFWQRFGGAMMLSLVDDVADYAIARERSRGRGGEMQFTSTGDAARDAASIALEHTINIPPTLNKNQGDHINVYVARDLDFRGVYELRSQ